MSAPRNMPTRSDNGAIPAVVDWTARTDRPRRSIFGNYLPPGPPASLPAGSPELLPGAPASLPANPPNQTDASDTGSFTDRSLSSDPSHLPVDLAVARSFLYSFLARAFEDPTPASWRWLCDPQTQISLAAAMRIALFKGDLVPPSIAASPQFAPDQFIAFQSDYLTAFGHAARGLCPLNEIEYGDIKADPLFQPHRLADLAAFYRAFGLEVADDAAERHDHICLECEFMSVLAAQEAYALEHHLGMEPLSVCRDAQKKFLHDHLARWLPAFTRRLSRTLRKGTLVSLAEFTRQFILAESMRFGIAPGSDDLLLRPTDNAAESLCDSCGLTRLPPGAADPVR